MNRNSALYLLWSRAFCPKWFHHAH